MREDEELEMLLDEIPHATSLNLHHLLHQHNHHVRVHDGHGHGSTPAQRTHSIFGDDPSRYHNYMCASPVSGVSLQSEGSSSSSLSGRLSYSDDGSPTSHPFDETKSQTLPRNTQYPNGLRLDSKFPDSPVRKNAEVNLMDELGLAGNFRAMHIRDDEKDSSIGPIQGDPYGFQFDGHSPLGTNLGHVEKNGCFEDCRTEIFYYERLQRSAQEGRTSFDDEMRSALLGLQRECQTGNLSGLYPSHGRSDALVYRPGVCTQPMTFPRRQVKEHGSNDTFCNSQLGADYAFAKNCYNRGTLVPNMDTSITGAFPNSQKNGTNFNGNRSVLNSPSFSHLIHPKLPLGVENLHCSLPTFDGRAKAFPNSWVAQSLPSLGNNRNFKDFNCEDSFIIQGKGLNYANRGGDRSRGYKKASCDEIGRENVWGKSSELHNQSHSGGIQAFNGENGRNPRIFCPLDLPSKFDSLAEVQGYIYFLAKRQLGCRNLQQKFDEGTAQDVQLIFNEIINHVVELMMDRFGNYLMQKLLDVCTEKQRMQILLMVTEEPGDLVKISLDMYGTRVVQKLIETLKTRQQISMVISALEPGFLDLIKDLNGNHVVQRCLQCLSNEDNKFIFYAAAKFCVDIATHRHGCCVLPQCIANSTGEHRENLVSEISTNGLLLAQDPFGNYVVQYIIGLKIPSATANLISQFEGNYVHLSMQKFSSNVVEKCLNSFEEENRSKIIHELLSSSQFEQLLQHQFGNYVIQCALGVTKGPLHASLVEAIQPHGPVLRTSPYCKRIFSRTLSKK